MTHYSAITVTLLVRPIFGQWSSLALNCVQCLALILWTLCMRLSTADTSELERLIGLAVIDSLDRSQMPVKHAALLMAMDENHLRQQLKAEPGRHLSIYRLARLPITFWVHFLPALSALVVKQHVGQLVEDVTFRKRA